MVAVIGRGLWRRLVLRLSSQPAPIEVTRSVDALAVVQRRLASEVIGPPLHVAWNRSCTGCGTLMRNTSPHERCQECRDEAERRAERERAVNEARQRRVSYIGNKR